MRLGRLTRWAAGAAVPVTFACLTTQMAQAAGAAPSPAAVLTLAEGGLTGDYEATYLVTGQLAVFPGPRWRVVVAHEGPPPLARPLVTDDATWSFFLHAGEGYQLQWVEKGEHFQDCWTMPEHPGWHCGRGTYEASNGFALATLAYIPATVVMGLEVAVQGGPGASPRLVVTQRASPLFGRLTCLSAVSAEPAALARGTTTRHPFATTCLTARGLVASQRQWGEGTWDDLTLVRWRPRPPASDFRPVATVGPSPMLPPL
ncbi:MAG TPA: hypothetical protein VL984_04885 [Acidimicrobiales bacterium]|nr:hypothetical protein [Acidimicrobiales bacterium]